MAKHTPGPWAVHGDHQTLIGSDDQKMMLAEVLWEHVCTEWGRDLTTAQANARLIAAAPDLLDALSGLIAWATREHGRKDAIGLPGEIITANAAIAKALGN